ncbi:kallikrein-8-like [Parambassis ranga]|uniref:Kallikrein-8-like n=1 Tax=Parambassis ranga TaxID=210632 RepID=A0A6P7HS10_9TELE|nr:kallikrein-8-like [Parambassis ranga]
MAHLTFLHLVLWVGVTVSTALDLQKRIYGGKDCDPAQRAYHVKLRGVSGGLCGGSLIHKQWILTSAHCKESKMKATVGSEPEVEITRTVVYPEHDIMLLLLPNPSKITPIRLPDCSEQPKIDKIEVAGNGRYKINEKTKEKLPGQPKKLQCAEMHISSCDEIKTKIQETFPNEPFEHWFCGKEHKVDTCKGDSGGGVVYNNVIYGIISGAGGSEHPSYDDDTDTFNFEVMLQQPPST